MSRRPRAGLVKSRRSKPAAPKRPSGGKVSRRVSSSAAGQESEIARLTRELAEARQEQKATADVLGVISSSPGELKPVFQAILDKAVRICEANFGHLVLTDGDLFRLAAAANTPAALAERLKRGFEPTPGSHFDRVRRTKQVSFTEDDTAEPVRGLAARYGGARSIIAVPMLNDQDLVGIILIYRQEVRPFTDKQIELVKNFAAQAVIAIENARLLNELRQSLEQQTATADVLRVISSSPGDLETVFQTMLVNAVRICAARFGVLFLAEGDTYRVVAMHNVPESYRQVRRREPTFQYSPSHPLARVAATKQMLQIADLQADASYAESDPSSYRAMVGLAGARTMLNVPMLRENELVGQIAIFRQEVLPFTEKQIELVRNFAAQAVIAIENTRLLNELRERTEEVVKLNQQLEQRVADQVGEIERMGMIAPFPAAASGRSNRRVRDGETAREPSAGNHRAVLRLARLYRLLRKF